MSTVYPCPKCKSVGKIKAGRRVTDKEDRFICAMPLCQHEYRASETEPFDVPDLDVSKQTPIPGQQFQPATSTLWATILDFYDLVHNLAELGVLEPEEIGERLSAPAHKLLEDTRDMLIKAGHEVK